MPVPNYGLWVAKPIRYDSERAHKDPKTPHIYLYFKDDPQARRERSAAINVKSRGRESRLVVWLVRNFTHRLTTELGEDLGFKLIQRSGGMQGLDYLRTRELIRDLKAGMVLPHDVPEPNNDIIDKLEPILDAAIKRNATIYLFGSRYDSETGIHNIHMNQGSLPHFDNGVEQDGGMLFRFSDHWEAVFLAFASQRIPTDNKTGEPARGSKSLAKILGVASSL